MLIGARWTSSRGGRAGFTLLEMVVVIGLVALLAGAVLTQVVGRTVDGEAAALSRNLDSLGRAVVAFRNDVRRYPGRLSYLSARPGAGSTDTCGAPIPGRFLQLWNGPYTDRIVSTGGITSGKSTIQDTLARAVPPAVPDTLVSISVQGVDREVADIVERTFDATASATDGIIRWTTGAGGQVTLTYSLPVRGC